MCGSVDWGSRVGRWGGKTLARTLAVLRAHEGQRVAAAYNYIEVRERREESRGRERGGRGLLTRVSTQESRNEEKFGYF